MAHRVAGSRLRNEVIRLRPERRFTQKGTTGEGTRYDLGLSTIAPSDETAVERGKEGDIRNDGLTVRLGYTYSL